MAVLRPGKVGGTRNGTPLRRALALVALLGLLAAAPPAGQAAPPRGLEPPPASPKGADARDAADPRPTAPTARPAESGRPGRNDTGNVAGGDTSASPEDTAPRTFVGRVDALLAREGLDRFDVGLLLFSVRYRRYLYEREIERPFIAASNAKLATTYAALRRLSPDYRWRTRVYSVQEHDAATGETRQGLLVRGSGDPTLTVRDLDRLALIVKSYGIDRLDGGIYLDAGLYSDEVFPAAWGDVSGAEPWYAPVSPFIVEKNVVDFVIAPRPTADRFPAYATTPVFRVDSHLQPAGVAQPQLHVEQSWDAGEGRFTLVGSLAAGDDPYYFSAAVRRPVLHFHALLRASLRRAGVDGEMPLRILPAGRLDTTHLYTHSSPPLRDVLTEVNKHSSNLSAEVLLRTLALQEDATGVTTADGVRAMRDVLDADFPPGDAPRHLVDGSGLSRESRVSPLFLVRLLNRVFQDFRIRAEFLNSLAVGGEDGTLEFRQYPWRMHGRVRAKSGTLKGVANLTGYLELPGDVVIFSFLINNADVPYLPLQEKQDRVLAGIYDALAVPGYPDAVLAGPDVARN